MPPALSVTLLCVLGAALLVLMVVGWRRRVRATSDVPAPPAVPSELGEPRTEELAGTYVSTTRSGDWLDRIAAHGLGVRSVLVVRVWDTGVELRRRGAPDVFLPRADLLAVGTSGGMAGKVVGGEGLTILTWQHEAHRLDTGLRLRHPADALVLREAVTSLMEHTEETR
ncbi:hypothetical protein [Cellulomonas sp. RIT-PI-Y]|uniref:PH-like domain-containing protein n=1 Tax=Cellulomonas sp. RIT-PI-Y TaxID=3035297 RepID=UPI0021D9F963|nr:hypothetical protein [Cellulomonas sp. RIT-PI-Y]